MSVKYFNLAIEGEDGRVAHKETVSEHELVAKVTEWAGDSLYADFRLTSGVDESGEPVG